MTRNVLLDTNLLIAAFDSNGTTSSELKSQAKAKLAALLADPNVRLFITPLIRYEVLRGIKWLSQSAYNDMRKALNNFPELDITRNIAELSANLFRFDSYQNISVTGNVKNVDKRKFDVFHYCCASCNNIEFDSNDTDIAKINQLHKQYLAESANR